MFGGMLSIVRNPAKSILNCYSCTRQLVSGCDYQQTTKRLQYCGL